jgi:uncharacterized phage protein gp47/JayE
MQDYGLSCLPAVYATGWVTFSRFTPARSALIPVGAQLETEEGAPTFVVVEDIHHPDYDATRKGYELAAGIESLRVPVQAQQPGRSGNVAAGVLTQLKQAIPGIDTLTNETAFANGMEAETDEAFRARFVSYMASLSKATLPAVSRHYHRARRITSSDYRK